MREYCNPFRTYKAFGKEHWEKSTGEMVQQAVAGVAKARSDHAATAEVRPFCGVARAPRMADFTNNSPTERLTMKRPKRTHRALTDMVFVKHMSQAMLRVCEKSLRWLSNGYQPIDNARPAHGSGLA